MAMLQHGSIAGDSPMGLLPSHGMRSEMNLNPTPLTVTTDRASRPMQSYLGAYNMSNRDYMARPGDNTNVSVWTAPEGQRGVTNLGEDFVLIAKMNLSWVTRRLLPLRVTNTREYAWEVTEFGTHYPDGMPYRGAVRIMGSNRRKGRATIRRHGFGAMLEHGFANTERGRRHFAMTLKQMEVSWQEFLDARGLEAIISSSEFTKKWLEVNGDPGRSIRMNYVAELEKRDWAALQKRDNAYANLIKDMKNDHMQVQGDAPMLDTVIMTQSIATFHPLRAKDQVTAFINGPDVVRNVRRGVEGFSTDEFGHTVYKTGARAVTEEGYFDPLDEQAMIGEHWKTLDARHINPALFQPGDYDFQIYDQSRDTFVDITLESLIANDQRFHPNNASVPWDKRDKPVSLDDPALSTGGGGYSPEERELDFLHIRDTRQGRKAGLRPIEFWGDLGVEHIQPEYIVKAAQVQLNRLQANAGLNTAELHEAINEAVAVIKLAASYKYDEKYQALLEDSVAKSAVGITSFGKGRDRVLAYQGNVFGSVVPETDAGDGTEFIAADLSRVGGAAKGTGGWQKQYIFSPAHLTPGGLRSMAMSVETDEVEYGKLFNVEAGKKIARAIKMIDKMCEALKQFNPNTATIDRQFSMPHHAVRNDADTFIEAFLLEDARAVPVFHITGAGKTETAAWYEPDRTFARMMVSEDIKVAWNDTESAEENALASLKGRVLAIIMDAVLKAKRSDLVTKDAKAQFTALMSAKSVNELSDAADVVLEYIRENAETLVAGGVTGTLTGDVKREIEETWMDRLEAASVRKNSPVGSGSQTTVEDFIKVLQGAAEKGELVFAPLTMTSRALNTYATYLTDKAVTPTFVPASQRNPAALMSITELREALGKSDSRFVSGNFETYRIADGTQQPINANMSEAQIASEVDSVFLAPNEYGRYLKTDPRHSTIIQASLMNAQAASSTGAELLDQEPVGAPFDQDRVGYGDLLAQRRAEAGRGYKRGYEEDASLISATSRYGQSEEDRVMQDELARLSKRQREAEDAYAMSGVQKSQTRTASGAINAFLHRTLSQRFSVLFAKVAEAAPTALLRWIALTILFTPVSNASRKAWVQFGLAPLHRWLVIRPHMRYWTSMMAMCTGDLGNTMVMPPEISIGNDVVTSMLMLTARLSSASVVTKRKNIVIRHHVYINALLGGSGSQFITRDADYAPAAGKYGRTDEHSLFAIAIPMNEEINEHLLNITGFMDYTDERGQAMYVSDKVRRPLSYSTAPFNNLVWHWHESRTNELFHPNVSAKHRRYYMPLNAYTWEAVGKYRRNGDVAFKTTQYGHWNIRCTGEGAKDLRNGGYFSETSPWMQGYARLTDVSLQ